MKVLTRIFFMDTVLFHSPPRLPFSTFFNSFADLVNVQQNHLLSGWRALFESHDHELLCKGSRNHKKHYSKVYSTNFTLDFDGTARSPFYVQPTD